MRRATVILLWLAMAHALRAGTVRTLDGKTYEGDVWLEAPDKIVVNAGAGGQPLKIDAADLLQVLFRPPDHGPRRADTAAHGALAPWKLQDVGVTGVAGWAQRSGTVFSVRAAGSGLTDTDADSFTFVYQPMWGNGQVVAEVRDVLTNAPDARVGIMVRQTLEPNSPFAALLLNPQRGEAVFSRLDARGHSIAQEDQRAAGPAWIRLVREGDVITAQRSRDGGDNHWEDVATLQMHLPQMVLAGLAVCSYDAARAAKAALDNVAVEGRAPPAPQANNAAAVNRAVVFRGGTVAADVTIQWADQNTIRFAGWDGRAASVPCDRVASLRFRPLSQQMLDKIPPRTTGVLLARGDFVEGEFRGLENGQIKLNSVLFGECKFWAGNDAVAVVLAPPAPVAPSALVVRTFEGSRFLTDSVSVDNGVLVFNDASVGPLRIPMSSLAEISAGAGRFDALEDLHPAKAEPGPAVDASLDGTPCEHAIGQAAGAARAYDLGGKYRLFMCRAGVSDAVLPTMVVRFVVLADGKELFRSDPRTSLDAALNLSLSVAGVKTMSLRVENATAVALPAGGLWADAALVK